uniref:Ubiquitin-like domain-containing protein n=1 Tax=Sinocyclocheilus grahami TaxID=75366 RepID=A0A672QLD2_SINGR
IVVFKTGASNPGPGELRSCRFQLIPINETDTPAQLEMENEDTIDVFQQQTGDLM